jgi:hypothetical protein
VHRVAALQAPNTLTGKLNADYRKNSEKLLLPPTYGGKDQPPEPADYDMLPVSWHQGRMKLLFSKATERGVQAAFMNKDDEAPWYFHPVIDNQLVRSGWFGGEKVYFDFSHAAGGFPNEGKVVTGPPVDMLEFMLRGCRSTSSIAPATEKPVKATMLRTFRRLGRSPYFFGVHGGKSRYGSSSS